MARLHFFAALSTVAITTSYALPLLCHSHTQPNPIAQAYPQDATGVINGTTAIIPIPYHVARGVIPAEYDILISAYRELFPTLPPDVYPAILEAVQDHDVKQFGIGIPDFTRMAIKYPFVDRLGDGYSSFKYSAPQLITAENLIAVIGSGLYGGTVPATFDPSCEAYTDGSQGETYLKGYAVPGSPTLGSKPDIASSFGRVDGIPYSLEAFKNITNQPLFGDGLPLCDNYITLFNTSVTEGRYAPVPVKGTVSVHPPFYPAETTFEGAYGYKMANAFIERNGVPCEELRGYHETGAGI